MDRATFLTELPTFGQRVDNWSIEVERKEGFLLARLFMGGTPVIGLDRHSTRVQGREGVIHANWYHWDLKYPYVPLSERHPRDPAIFAPKRGDELDRQVLALLESAWYIVFEDP